MKSVPGVVGSAMPKVYPDVESEKEEKEMLVLGSTMTPVEVAAREVLLSARTEERGVSFMLKIACVLLVQLKERGEEG